MSFWVTRCNAVNLLRDVSLEPYAMFLTLLGSVSSRSAKFRIRTSGGSHIGAYMRDRCYHGSASDVHRSVCNDDSREDESVSIQPVRILRIEFHELVEQDMGYWSQTHGRTRVTGVGGERCVDLVVTSISASHMVRSIEALSRAVLELFKEVGNHWWGSQEIHTANSRIVLIDN